jgi:predicted secreted protein
MANNVQGRNIMLYSTQYNAKYYFNGGINSTSIGGVTYKQLGTTENVAPWVILNNTGDGLVAGFITDIGYPNATSIAASTWTFKNYIALYQGTSGTPQFNIKVSKYNGTTLTTIATSANVNIIESGNTLYTTNVSIPATTLDVTDRIVVQIFAVNIGERLIEWYTQGSSVNTAQTTLPVDIPFACSTNCTFDVQIGQKEVTSQSSAWYQEFKIDVSTWSISCDGLITLNNFGYLNFLNIQKNRTPIFVKFVIDNGPDGLVIISGTCNLSSFQINAPFKDISTYSVSLQGTGAYGTSGTSINPSGNVVIGGGSVVNKQYVAAGAETTITFADMVGKTCLYVSRGGVDVREIVSGTPTGEQVGWNSNTGVLTFARALESDEFVRGLFQ